jgi:hypothetical protein
MAASKLPTPDGTEPSTEPAAKPRRARYRGRLNVEHIVVRTRGGDVHPEDKARLAEVRRRCAELKAAGTPVRLIVIEEHIVVAPAQRQEPAAASTDTMLPSGSAATVQVRSPQGTALGHRLCIAPVVA